MSSNNKSTAMESLLSRFNIKPLSSTKFHQDVLEASQEPLRGIDIDTEDCDTNIDEPSSSALAVIVEDETGETSNIPELVIPASENIPKHIFVPTEELLSPSDADFERIEVNHVSYIITNRLGHGGSSIVYDCFDKKTKSWRAIKEVDISDAVCSASYITEIELLKKLQHCNRIIKMYDYEIIESKQKLLVVLERGHLDLSKMLIKLSSTHEHLPIHELIYYWMEMLYGVQQIHENGIVHNDLKPANFLIMDGLLKLIDFGISTPISEDMTSVIKNVRIGTLNYISPEALIDQQTETSLDVSMRQQTPKYKINYKSDVWSLGCILYELVYGRPPFKHYSGAHPKLSVIMDPNHKIEYPEVDWIPKGIINIMKSCLEFDKNLRPTVQELIENFENTFY